MEVSPARIITSRSRPSAIPPCGGAPYSSASSRKPKRRLASSSENPSARENLGLHVAAMNTNGARAQLGAVQHQVVRFGAAARRIAGQLLDIFVVHRSERMMRRVPAILFLVPFEHREIDHPERLENSSGRAACAGRCISGRRTDAAARRPDRTSLRDAGPCGGPGHPAISSKSSSAAPDAARACSTSFGIQLFQIVVNTQPALGSELFQFVALLAAQRAGLRNVDRHRRKSSGRAASDSPSNT